jgi:hypothetical protein
MLEIRDPAAFGGALALALFVGILLALRVGRLIGERSIRKYGAAGLPSIGSLETATFALLGLLIAFTFSGALTRFDVRRAQAVDEANAIGTAWLRIDLLPASAQPKMRDTFKAYVDARIATYDKIDEDLAAAKQEFARSAQLQSEIWAQAIAALKQSDARPNADMLVLPALNSMFDITTVRAVATQIHPPMVIYWMLIGCALAAALLAGYQASAEKGYSWVHKIGFSAIIALTIYVILDMEYPRRGFIRIDAIDQVLVNVRAGMK